MSRYNLSLVFEQPKHLPAQAKDRNGWTVEDWFNDGFMGWDAENCTYFLHLEAAVPHPTDPEDGVDVLAWNFGQRPGQVTSPFEVQAILGALFGVAGNAFAFKENVLLALLGERDRMFAGERDDDGRDLVMAFHANDGAYAQGVKRPHEDWLAAHAKMGVLASDRLVAPVA
ncbi:TPA: hypothetical protein QDB45_005299 [Burkholderia vietnamiensis]|nr:hypothetical protein [Burkholderia vietnamiensis]